MQFMKIIELEINEYNNKIWKLNGLPHRDNDMPAIIYPNGSCFWFKNGIRHRDKGPASTYPNGQENWWNNGLFIKATRAAS